MQRLRLLGLAGTASSTCWPKNAKDGMLPILRGGDTSDFRPKLEGSGPCGSVVGGGDVLMVERKEVVDLIMRGEEPLCLTGGFEPLHLPFSPPARLV